MKTVLFLVGVVVSDCLKMVPEYYTAELARHTRESETIKYCQNERVTRQSTLKTREKSTLWPVKIAIVGLTYIFETAANKIKIIMVSDVRLRSNFQLQRNS